MKKKKKKRWFQARTIFSRGKGIAGFLSQITSLVLIRTFQIDCFKGHVSGIGGLQLSLDLLLWEMGQMIPLGACYCFLTTS